MVRDGSDSVRAVLRVDGRKLRRVRDSHNYFCLDAKKFMAVRSGVPDELARLIRVDDLNFQGQHDPLFLLTDTTGAAARRLDSVVDLTTIDSALSAAAARVRRSSAMVDACGINRERLQTELKRLQWVPRYLRLVSRLDKLDKRAAGLRARASLLDGLLRSVAEIRSSRNSVLRQAEALEPAVAAADRIVGLNRRVRRLDSLVQDAAELASTAIQNQTEQSDIQTELSAVKECPLCQRPL
jgi:hypothetical protein